MKEPHILPLNMEEGKSYGGSMAQCVTPPQASQISSGLGVLRGEGGFNIHFPPLYHKYLFRYLLVIRNFSVNCVIAPHAYTSVGLFFLSDFCKYFLQT